MNGYLTIVDLDFYEDVDSCNESRSVTGGIALGNKYATAYSSGYAKDNVSGRIVVVDDYQNYYISGGAAGAAAGAVAGAISVGPYSTAYTGNYTSATAG